MKSKKMTAGFTLVELIVVIAILGILAGVGTVGYSGYIKKANMAADQTLISSIENALKLGFYNGTFADNEAAGIVLSTAGIVNADEVAGTNLEEALIDTFGTGYADTLKLKYDGWKGVTSDKAFADAYMASSYSGNEDALIAQIGSVTNLLKDALASAPNLVGNSFNSYLTGNGIDTNDNQAVSNAAVLYAADTIGNLDATKEAAVNAAFQTFYDPSAGSSYGNIADLTLALKNELGTYGAVAAIYAHGEAFGQYVAANGNDDLLNDFHNVNVEDITNTDEALTQVANNLSSMVYLAQTDETINPFAMQYIGEGQYAKDVTAYLESMKKIDANADKFTDKLDSAGCYTDGTAASLLQAAVSAGSADISCGDGEVFVTIGKDGSTYSSISGTQN